MLHSCCFKHTVSTVLILNIQKICWTLFPLSFLTNNIANASFKPQSRVFLIASHVYLTLG